MCEKMCEKMCKTNRKNSDYHWEKEPNLKAVGLYKKNKRFERALKTKDFSDFIEEEDEDKEDW